MVVSQCSALNVNCSSTSATVVIAGSLEVSSDTYTEDLNVNDIYDWDQGYIYVGDDIEVENGELIRADTYNLNLTGGTDPVVIGAASIGGSYDDLYVVDDFDVGGTKNCIAKADDGRKFIYSAIESPEIWFEEKISSELINGEKEIILDERFLATTVIDENHPLHVIAVPTSKGATLWVEKFYNKIIVHGNCKTFDVTISAKRKGYENRRFDELKKDEDLNMEYKKSNEERFLKQKPLRLETKQIKNEMKIIRENADLLRKEIIDEDKKEIKDEELINQKRLEHKKEMVKLPPKRNRIFELNQQLNIIK